MERKIGFTDNKIVIATISLLIGLYSVYARIELHPYVMNILNNPIVKFIMIATILLYINSNQKPHVVFLYTLCLLITINLLKENENYQKVKQFNEKFSANITN